MSVVEILTRAEVRAIIREELRGAGCAYSQRDGERPAGCGRVKYLRVWRLAYRAGDTGARAQGKARLLMPEAFERFEAQLRKPRRAALHVVPEPSTDDRMLAALGGRRT